MANKRLDYDKIYELVMECCKSEMSDRRWCINYVKQALEFLGTDIGEEDE